MVCTTWLNDNDYKRPVSDKELQKLLEEVCRVTGKDYRLAEHFWSTGHLWWKKSGVCYELYYGVEGYAGRVYEHQVVNFYRGEGSCSLPGGWDCTAISAHFYGVLTYASKCAVLQSVAKEGEQPAARTQEATQ